MSEFQVQHEEVGHRGTFFHVKDGQRLAEMTYTRSNASLVLIDHTDVNDVLRGQGAGRKLLDALVAWARQTNTKVIAVCPYAKGQFEKEPGLRDVLST